MRFPLLAYAVIAGGLGGALEVSRGEGPTEQALMSWLVRQAESRADLIDAAAAREQRPGRLVVLRTPRTLQRHAQAALSSSLDAIGLALAHRPETAEAVAVAAGVA